MQGRYSILISIVIVLFFIWGYSAATQQHVAKDISLEAEALTVVPHSPATTTLQAVRIPIFIYHSVRPDFQGENKSQRAYSVTPEELDQELGYIRDHGYTVISLDELQKDVESGTVASGQKPVVLTFDDGWQNQFDYALPILKKYNDTATFFIFTNPISRDKRFMTWDEVKTLEAAGMTIGDHSLSHPYFNKLSEEEMRHEVVGGKRALEAELGHPVLHFATPFGYTSSKLEEILKEAGLVTGRTTYWGAEHSKDDELRLSGYLVERDIKKFAWALEESK